MDFQSKNNRWAVTSAMGRAVAEQNKWKLLRRVGENERFK